MCGICNCFHVSKFVEIGNLMVMYYYLQTNAFGTSIYGHRKLDGDLKHHEIVCPGCDTTMVDVIVDHISIDVIVDDISIGVIIDGVDVVPINYNLPWVILL
jgi:hypothetical protein